METFKHKVTLVNFAITVEAPPPVKLVMLPLKIVDCCW